MFFRKGKLNFFLKLISIKYSQIYLLEDGIKSFARKLVLVLKTCNSLVLDRTSVSSTDCTCSVGDCAVESSSLERVSWVRSSQLWLRELTCIGKVWLRRSRDLVLLLCREERRNGSPGSILWPRRCTESRAPWMTYSVSPGRLFLQSES